MIIGLLHARFVLCVQRICNTDGTNDAKMPNQAIFMPYFPIQYVSKTGLML